MSKQLVPFLDKNGNCIGHATKNDVHRDGRLHRAVSLFVARTNKPEVLVYKRGTHQSFSGRLDIPGGHEDVCDGGSLDATARREACEELVANGNAPLEFKVELLSKPEQLVSTAPTNCEWSSLFGMRLPSGLEVRVQDEGDDGKTLFKESKFETLDSLLKQYQENPEFAADGLGRVLQLVKTDEQFRKMLSNWLNRRTWTVAFESFPGGGGGDEFYFEKKFFGTEDEAEAFARDTNYFRYYGDAFWSIRPD